MGQKVIRANAIYDNFYAVEALNVCLGVNQPDEIAHSVSYRDQTIISKEK